MRRLKMLSVIPSDRPPEARLEAHNASATGSRMRIARAMLAEQLPIDGNEPPTRATSTERGLERRAATGREVYAASLEDTESFELTVGWESAAKPIIRNQQLMGIASLHHIPQSHTNASTPPELRFLRRNKNRCATRRENSLPKSSRRRPCARCSTARQPITRNCGRGSPRWVSCVAIPEQFGGAGAGHLDSA